MHGAGFPDLGPEQQDDLVARLWAGTLPDFVVPDQRTFAQMLLPHVQEGLFADPAHGGNRDKQGWRFLGPPGALAGALRGGEPRDRAGDQGRRGPRPRRRRLAERTASSPASPSASRATRPSARSPRPPPDADVVLVGMGAVGGFVAPMLAGAGLRVVGLEAGPYRTAQDFVPDELNAAYYCRGDMGPKFQAERPRWRPRRGRSDPTRRLHAGPHDERRRRQRRALGRRAAALPPAPLRVPVVDRRAVRARAPCRRTRRSRTGR